MADTKYYTKRLLLNCSGYVIVLVEGAMVRNSEVKHGTVCRYYVP